MAVVAHRRSCWREDLQLDVAVAVAVAVTVVVVLLVGCEHGAGTCRTCCWGACSGSRRHGPPCTAGTGQSTCMLTDPCLTTGNGQEVRHHARSGQLQQSMPFMPSTRRRGSKCSFVIRCVGGKDGEIYCIGFLFQGRACCSPYPACSTPALRAQLPNTANGCNRAVALICARPL